MQAAHQAGVVHRDLKPANVLLSFSREPEASAGSPERSPDGSRLNGVVPKVADFGLAKTLGDDPSPTRTGAVIGTPSYMAPEQAEGKTREHGPLVDVSALGAILYECLTGRPPFRAASVLDTLAQVRAQEPVAPRALNAQVPRDLETICLKCLHKGPGQRYASAQGLADDLARFLEGRPIQARPASAWDRAWKFARRNKALVGGALSVFVVLLGGIIATRFQYGRAEGARKEAQRARDDEIAKSEALREALLKQYVDAARLAVQQGQLKRATAWIDRTGLQLRKQLEAFPKARP
jgi:hypothetical protein